MPPRHVKLEVGHRSKQFAEPDGDNPEKHTHRWTVFVQSGISGVPVEHFVERVQFTLHESFDRPIRVISTPPFAVCETGYAGFIIPIVVVLKYSKKELKFNYDMNLKYVTSDEQKSTLSFEVTDVSHELSAVLSRGKTAENTVADHSSVVSKTSKTKIMPAPSKPINNNNNNTFNDLFGQAIQIDRKAAKPLPSVSGGKPASSVLQRPKESSAISAGSSSSSAKPVAVVHPSSMSTQQHDLVSVKPKPVHNAGTTKISSSNTKGSLAQKHVSNSATPGQSNAVSNSHIDDKRKLASKETTKTVLSKPSAHPQGSTAMSLKTCAPVPEKLKTVTVLPEEDHSAFEKHHKKRKKEKKAKKEKKEKHRSEPKDDKKKRKRERSRSNETSDSTKHSSHKHRKLSGSDKLPPTIKVEPVAGDAHKVNSHTAVTSSQPPFDANLYKHLVEAVGGDANSPIPTVVSPATKMDVDDLFSPDSPDAFESRETAEFSNGRKPHVAHLDMKSGSTTLKAKIDSDLHEDTAKVKAKKKTKKSAPTLKAVSPVVASSVGQNGRSSTVLTTVSSHGSKMDNKKTDIQTISSQQQKQKSPATNAGTVADSGFESDSPCRSTGSPRNGRPSVDCEVPTSSSITVVVQSSSNHLPSNQKASAKPIVAVKKEPSKAAVKVEAATKSVISTNGSTVHSEAGEAFSFGPQQITHLVNLQRRIMNLTDRRTALRIIEIIEQNGTLSISPQSVDFDLCEFSQDIITKLEECLDSSPT